MNKFLDVFNDELKKVQSNDTEQNEEHADDNFLTRTRTVLLKLTSLREY